MVTTAIRRRTAVRAGLASSGSPPGKQPAISRRRAELSGTPVVVKQLIDAPEAAERYAREVAALKLASRVDPPVVPMLVGTDPGERVLVLEYVDHQPPREG
ncbi:hypothetical protein V1460_13390 [Streptomyces sp. SCSIO 30461]|uniref:hypothetical protein n=1 Tax=Streptomyces sp. SCSIO 30461 TaxID=3118085 RepID=UPI0030CC4A07